MGIGCIYFEQDVTYTLALVGGITLGLVFTPDLDVDNGCISIHVVRKHFGKIPSTLWQYYWLPYARVMSHRGLSHTPLLGTLTRLVYFFPFWLLFIFCYTYVQFWLVLAGLALADIVHWGLDTLDSFVGGKL